MMEKRVGGDRRPCRIAAVVTTERHRAGVACTIENISERGAKIKFATELFLPRSFKLRFAAGRQATERLVELRWSLGTVVGVQFQ